MISSCMFESVKKSIDLINAVGLREAWFSVDETDATDFIGWAKSEGYNITRKEWNHPQGLYIHEGKPRTAYLAVYSLCW